MRGHVENGAGAGGGQVDGELLRLLFSFSHWRDLSM